VIRPSATIALVLLLSLGLLGAACDGDNGGGSPTGQVTPLETSAENGTPLETPAETSEASTPGARIRDVDFTQEPAVADYLRLSGGQIDPASIIYADLTDDGIEDAVVPISSGGEGGFIALFVYAPDPSGTPQQVLDHQSNTSLTVTVENGQLVVREASFAEGDPFCCPSQIKVTVFEWDGSALAVLEERTEPAPQ
jgi:hypothetical protein